MTDAPGRWWIVRHPTSGGAIVAKFDGVSTVPDSIAEYGDFVVQEVAGTSALTDKTVDWSGLSDSEIDRLIPHYPTPPSATK